MSEQKKIEQAKVTFDTLCQTLERLEWSYKKDQDNLSIECGAQGEDLPMKININVDIDRMLIMLISHMPFTITEDKRLDVAVAVSAVNAALIDGSFDYDITSGYVLFRMTNSFVENTISEEVFSYMLHCSCQTIDEYNDKFLMLSKGLISTEQFLSMCAF